MLNVQDSERQDKLKDMIITESLGLSIHSVGKFDTQKRQSRAEWWGGDMRAELGYKWGIACMRYYVE